MAKNTAIVILLVFVFWACANPLPPSGGDVDKIPPYITEIFPADSTLNFSEKYIEITFSEYVDRSAAQQAVFISPKPKGEIEYSWSGKTLEMSFSDTAFVKDMTYVVSIGTDVRDLNNGNPMTEAYMLRFSTGLKIDDFFIKGKVYYENMSGVMIFAYKGDSLRFISEKMQPDYISQAGQNGDYLLGGLAEGNYTLLAVKDEFRDLKYSKETDAFGIQQDEIILSIDNPSEIIDFRMAKEDTTAPNIKNVIMTDMNRIVTEISELPVSGIISPENVRICDSTSMKDIKPAFVYKNYNKKSEFVIVIKDSLNKGNNCYLKIFNLADEYGNRNKLSELSFAPAEKKDTVQIKIGRIVGLNDDPELDPDESTLLVNFSKEAEIAGNEVFYISSDNEPKILCVFERIDGASVRVISPVKFGKGKKMKLLTDFSKIKDINGIGKDTLLSSELKVAGSMDFSGVSGTVSGDANIPLVKVELKQTGGKNKYEVKPSADSKFKFPRVKPGSYIISAFEDTDSNNVYTFGKPDSIKFSEKFTVYPDTLNLRARWPVGDVNIEFRKKKK